MFRAMTVRFECTTIVAAPIQDLFDLSLSIDAHTGSMARYHERAVGGVTHGQIGTGEEVTWRARHFGVSWSMTSRIVAVERPTRFVDEQVSGPFASFRHVHRFASMDDRTQMIDEVTFRAPWGALGWTAERGLRWYLFRLIQTRNSYLKRAAEGRA